MRRFSLMVCLAALLVVIAGAAQAETQVEMTGDSRVYGVYFSGHNFTGWKNAGWTSNTPTWSAAGQRAEDKFEIWERFRLRADFMANRDLRFRFAAKVDTTWGNGSYTAANPTAGIAPPAGGSVASGVQVYQAYLLFKWPGTDIQVNAGLQPLSFPQSSIFNDSLMFADFASALTIEGKIVPGTLGYLVGFARMLDDTQTFDNAKQVGDELDLYFLTLPITLDGIKATPWAMVGVAGKYTNYFTSYASSFAHTTNADCLLSAGTLDSQTSPNRHWKNNQVPYVWAGGAFEVSTLDPVRFYADVLFGSGAFNDRRSSRRQGWLIDTAVEYTGWNLLRPQIFAWWASGEDGSTSNGSERLPHMRTNWGPGNSFLFDDGQVYGRNAEMGMEAAGSMGFAVSLDKITFMEKLSHRLTFTYVRGTNSPTAIRDLNNNMGSNPYFAMGRDLTWNEYAYGVNFDSNYALYENLNLRVETGWAHGEFQRSVWGRDLVNRSKNGDSWKVAFGFTYRY